jgi:predicted regulator of Ras-like GTPase activity (Roadblock/LC7/MglB family)
MDAQQALADLTEISSQIQAAVIFDERGKIAASTLSESAAEELARGAAELLEHADGLRVGEAPPAQLEAATGDGSIFVVRDAKTRIAATTVVNPTVGLVFYDLKSALRQVEAKPAPKRKAATKTATAADKKPAAPRKKKPAPRKKTDAS